MTRSRFWGERRGSALLIVLGFLSFMVVSAVSFAIYMRAERMPSSALRRSVATRHLVKAALAEAISRIDDAVRDDPFPGLCATNTNGEVADASKFYFFRNDGGVRNQAVDVWDGRVFMPLDPLGGTINAEMRYAPITETASPLTLEGLGYVPPGLVNDVRFLSRSSWAASWQSFPFDAGRFCYCVVNVSDYLDVNRISANKPRTAEAGRRLSIAHLFDSNFDPLDARANNTYSGSSVENPDGSASTFDDFAGQKDGSPFASYVAGDNIGGTYERWSPVGNSSPYVSVMDYNLALAAGGPNSFLKPLFYNWLSDKKKDQSYYIAQSNGKGSTDMASALRQPFVADSWSTNETWTVDISTPAGQPFQASAMKDKNGRATYDEIQNMGSTFMNTMDPSKLFGFVDYVMLFDYLDHNNVPVSLALPCVERVPMVVGLTPPQFAPTKFNAAGDDETKTWNFDARRWFSDEKELQAVVAFPFRHGRDRESRSYKAQALVRLVYAPLGANKGTLGASVRPSQTDWTTTGLKMDSGLFAFTGLSREQGFTVPETVRDEAAACSSGSGLLSFRFGDFTPNQLPNSVDVLRMETVPDGNQGGGDGTQKKKKVYTVLVSPLDEKGAAVFPVGQQMEQGDFNAKSGVEFVPHVFVWVRIVDGNGKTVDLVPAGFEDDKDVAGRQLSMQLSQECAGLVGERPGQGSKPAFEFISDAAGAKLSFAAIAADTFGGGDADWTPKALYAVDPRFNAQPEHWYSVNTMNISFSDWLSKTRAALGDNSMADRDQDIFMFNSNQGMLQSMGEFAFLPYLHVPGDDIAAFSFTSVSGDGTGVPGANALDVMNRFKYLWRTYNASEFYSRAAERGIGRNTQREQLVNPHTDDLSVMLAALANTPYDYWATACGIDDSNNALFKEYGNTDFDGFKNFSDARDFTFSSRNSDAKLQYVDLVKIAKVIMTAMGGLNPQASDEAARAVQQALEGVNVSEIRNSVAKLLKNEIRSGSGAVRPSQVWQLVWDKLWNSLAFDLDANDENSFREFLGINMQEPLYTVDRKFLYSYWRDCFANKQQLFLVFVRAESSALGGPGEGTPAQLGGRAVALVWRDPDWTEGNGDNGRDRDFDSEYKEEENKMRPHRTRVLFYHQFD